MQVQCDHQTTVLCLLHGQQCRTHACSDKTPAHQHNTHTRCSVVTNSSSSNSLKHLCSSMSSHASSSCCSIRPFSSPGRPAAAWPWVRLSLAGALGDVAPCTEWQKNHDASCLLGLAKPKGPMQLLGRPHGPPRDVDGIDSTITTGGQFLREALVRNPRPGHSPPPSLRSALHSLQHAHAAAAFRYAGVGCQSPSCPEPPQRCVQRRCADGLHVCPVRPEKAGWGLEPSAKLVQHLHGQQQQCMSMISLTTAA
jgi:hypothetical protein